MRILCFLTLLSGAVATIAPVTLDAHDIGFRLNVLKASKELTKCPEKENNEYTVVSLIRTNRERAKILNPYVVKLLMQCHVQEVHTWDLYEKEDGSGHLAGEMENFDGKVPEMLKLWDDWRQRHVRANWASFYQKYDVPDRKKAVLIKLEDSILYLDPAGLAKASQYAMDNKDNFLTIPNIVSGSTAASHEKCLPKGFNLMSKSKDELAAETHRYFLKDPACFSLSQTEECVELDNSADNTGTPLGAFAVSWENLEDVSSLLKISNGESKALVNEPEGSMRRSCIHKATMASICSSTKNSEEMYLPVYKMLSKRIQAGGRITDEGLSEEILRINGLDQEIPKKKRMLFAKDSQVVEPATCPRIRSYVDLGKCNAPQKHQMKWLQLKETVPTECRRPCTAAPVEIQGARFIAEDKKLALFSSPKLTKPLTEMIQTKSLNIHPANPEASLESKDYNVVVSAHEPLDGFAQTMTTLLKSMKQIGVDKRSLKQTIADCKASPEASGCKALLTQKLPILEKWLDLESFDHSPDKVTSSLIQSVFSDIKRLVYPGCEAQLGAGTTPQMASFLPSYLQTQAKTPFHVIREEYAESDLQELWQKLGMKVGSSLAEFGYSAKDKSSTEVKSAAQDLQKDVQDAISLLEQKQEGHATQSREATIKAMQDIAMDADANVEVAQDQEIIKSLIKEDAELTKSFCSIYSMDYSCLGYSEEFEKICGSVDGPEKVSMKKEFILKVSAPKLALRKKLTTSMHTMGQKSCLTQANSQISYIPFVDTVENCKAHCKSKGACQSFNYDQATFGCRLYGEAPVGAVLDLHSTCGAMCKNSDDSLRRAMEQKGLHSLGSSCDSAAQYCNQDDVMIHCPVTCGRCEIDM